MDFFRSGTPLTPLGPEPVVRNKPAKAREISTAVIIPKAVKSLDKLSRDPVKKEVPAEIYYEGYVDDTKYIVSDTNLEIMKDMINYKMRPKTSIRFKNETLFENVNYERLQRRLASMLDKVKTPSDTQQNSVIREQTSRGIGNEETAVAEDPETRRISEKEDDEGTVISELEPVTSSDQLEPQVSGGEDEDSGEQRARFLISGHLDKDNKPVYIIQEYEGRSSILKDQTTNFMTCKEQGNVSVSISGRIFKDSILIEEDGNPKSLSINADNIIIDPEKSKIFRDVLEETLSIEGVNIYLKGKFLENKSQRQFTPMLSFNIVNKDVETPSIFDDQNTLLSGKNMSTFIIYQPLFSTYDDESLLYKPKGRSYKYSSRCESCITGNKPEDIAEKRSTRLIKQLSVFANITNRTTSSELLKKNVVTNKKKNTKEIILKDLENFYKHMSFLQALFRNSEQN